MTRLLERISSSTARATILALGTTAAAAIAAIEILDPAGAAESERYGSIAWLTLTLWLLILLAIILAVLPARFDRHADRRTSLDPATVPAGHHQTPTVTLSYPLRLARLTTARSGWLAAGAVLIAVTYRGIFQTGPLTYGDWGYFARSVLAHSFLPFPPLWTPQALGTNNLLGAPQYALLQLEGALAAGGLSYSLIERILYFAPAIGLLYFLMYTLLRRSVASPAAAAAGALVATLNTYEISIIAGGWLTIALGIAILPALLLLSTQIGRTSPLPLAVSFAALLGLAAWVSPPMAYLDGGALLLIVVITGARGPRGPNRWDVRAWLLFVAMGCLSFAALQATWLIPTVAGLSPHLPSGYQSPSALGQFSFQSLVDGLAVFQPAWPTLKAFSVHSLPFLGVAFPLLALAALLRRPLPRSVAALALLYLVSAWLSSGAVSPLPMINYWVFSHVPGASVFRNPVLYLGPAGVALGFLVAHALRTNAHSEHRLSRDWHGRLHRAVSVTASGIAAAYLLVGTMPAVVGNIHENLFPTPPPSGITAAAAELHALPPGNVLWIPEVSRWANPYDAAHPSIGLLDLETLYGKVTGENLGGLAAIPFWLGTRPILADVLHDFAICYVVLDRRSSPYAIDSLDRVATLQVASAGLTGLPSQTFSGQATIFRLPCHGDGLVSTSATIRRRSAVIAMSGRLGVLPASPHPAQPSWNLVSTGTLRQLPNGGAVVSTRHTLHTPLIVTHFFARSPSKLAGTFAVAANAPVEVTASLFSARELPPVATLDTPASSSPASDFVVALNALVPQVPRTYPSVYDSSFLELAFQSTRPGPLIVKLSPLYGPDKVGSSGPSVTAAPSTKIRDACSAQVMRLSVAPSQYTGVLPPGSECTATRYLVLWQTYSRGWVAYQGGHALSHVLYDGWANGFVLRANHLRAVVTITFQPQSALDDGLLVSDAAAVLLLLILLFWAINRWARLHGVRNRFSMPVG